MKKLIAFVVGIVFTATVATAASNPPPAPAPAYLAAVTDLLVAARAGGQLLKLTAPDRQDIKQFRASDGAVLFIPAHAVRQEMMAQVQKEASEQFPSLGELI